MLTRSPLNFVSAHFGSNYLSPNLGMYSLTQSKIGVIFLLVNNALKLDTIVFLSGTYPYRTSSDIIIAWDGCSKSIGEL